MILFHAMLLREENLCFVVLLPHHDDEIFLISYLKFLQERFPDAFVHFCFLTYDESEFQIGERRKVSSHTLISSFARRNSYTIWNLGHDLGIRPRELSPNRLIVIEAVESVLAQIELSDVRIVLMAPLPENTHTDHLEASLIALTSNNAYEILFYPTYSLEQYYQISVLRKPALGKNRTKFLFRDLVKGISFHRIEWKTWIVLGPLLSLQTVLNRGFGYLFDSREALEYLLTSKNSWLGGRFMWNPKWRRHNLEILTMIEKRLRHRRI